MKKCNKCMALLLAWCLVLQCTMVDTARLVHAEQTVKEFIQDNCLICVKQQAGWKDGYIANVDITNTSDTIISNWKLEMSVLQGEITNIWNGKVQQNENKITISALDYNRTLSAGETISLGYEMNGQQFEKLALMVLSEGAKTTLTDEQYIVSYKIVSQWDRGAVIEASIRNCSDEAITDWELSCQFAGQIKDIWNGSIVSRNDDNYIIRNKGYNTTIQPEETVTFGFQASFLDEVISCPKNEVVTGSKEGSRQPGCTSTQNPATEEITGSDNTTQETTGETTNSNSTTEELPEIDWDDKTDTDKDGLPDVYEDYRYGTDKNKSDTDGDGLPDGFEVQYTQTNPCLADSDDNGILDGEEDFDEDGLNHFEEYKAQTPPLLADADDDGLTDGEELQYQTRWDKEDTDEDGVSDYDEVQLGLNPNEPMTYAGIKDSEYASRQKITAEELGEVNDVIDEFDISFDVKATNYLPKHLYAEVYDSCEIMNQNSAIVGSPVYFHYSDGEIKEGHIIFSLDETYVSNNGKDTYGFDEAWGLKRYGVFSYNEELSMLVPVACSYQDEANKILVDASKEYDNLCIMDLEQLLHNMGNDGNITKLSVQSDSYSQLNAVKKLSRAATTEDYNGVTIEAAKCAKQVDLVLNVEASRNMGPYLTTIKKGLQPFMKKLQAQNIDLRVSIISYMDVARYGSNSTVVNNGIEEDFVTELSEMQTLIDSIKPSSYARTSSMVDTLAHTNELEYRQEALKIAVLFSNSETNINTNSAFKINDLDDLTPMLKENNISVCTCAPIDLSYEYEYVAMNNGGMYFSSNYYNNIYNFIMKKVNNSYQYNAVAGNNLSPIFLDEQLTKGGSCDTDGDGLTDSKEVDWSKIRCYKDAKGNKRAELPTLQSLWTSLGYGQELYEGNPLLIALSTQSVLPVISFPNLEDSDGDDIIDSEDEDVLKYNPDLIDDAALDDSNLDSQSSVPSRARAKANSTITESTTKKGTIVDGSYTCKMNTYANNKRKFCGKLTPKRDSDYAFSVISTYGFKKNATFKVFKKNRFGKKKEVKSYKSETKSRYKMQYYYALKKGEEYMVEFSCKTKKKEQITFSCRQDNWVYAKDGAMWEVDMKSLTLGQLAGKAFPLDKCFVTRKMLYAAACENEELYMTDKALIENVMLKLGYSKDKYTITKKDVNTYLVSLGGEVIAIVSLFFVPEKVSLKLFGGVIKVKDAKNALTYITMTGVGTNTISFVDTTIELLDKLVKNLEYNAIIKALDTDANSLVCTYMVTSGTQRVWDSWKESHLINKYQLGCRGKIDVDIKTKDVIEFCGWENPQNRK